MRKIFALILVINYVNLWSIQVEDMRPIIIKDPLEILGIVSHKLIKFGGKYTAYAAGPFIISNIIRRILDSPENEEWLEKHPKTQIGLTSIGCVLGIGSAPILAAAGVSLGIGMYGWAAYFIIKKSGLYQKEAVQKWLTS